MAGSETIMHLIRIKVKLENLMWLNTIKSFWGPLIALEWVFIV